jgi:mediator of RNA polymerase II transcription subunit 8
MTENGHLFQRLAVHPSTNYPGRTQEGILLQLLRKKPEPDVEAWFEEGREMASRIERGGNADYLRALWSEVREWCMERIQRYVVEESGDVYTVEERAFGVANVRTGLRRALEEDSDEEEEGGEDGDVAMGGGNGGKESEPTVLPEFLLVFEGKGDFELPKTLEFESRKGEGQRGASR